MATLTLYSGWRDDDLTEVQSFEGTDVELTEEEIENFREVVRQYDAWQARLDAAVYEKAVEKYGGNRPAPAQGG